jgi:hypothetical protein
MTMWPQALVGSRSATYGTTLTAAGSAHTKGSYGVLTSALPIPCDGFILSVLPQSPESYLLDIAIGAAASEIVILPNLQFNGPTNQFGQYHQVFIPLRIPLGERVSGRIQATAASSLAYTYIYPVAGPFFAAFGGHRATNYGANTADSGGVTITPSTSANVKGVYSQLSAAVDGFTSCIFVCGVDDPGNAYDNANFAYDIAIGAAASEVIIHPDLQARSTTTTDDLQPCWQFVPLSVKSGERLAVRGSSDITTADRITDAMVIGFQ